LRDLGGHLFDRDILGDRCALVAALDIGPKAPRLERDSVAEILRPVTRRFAAGLAEFLGVAALRIIGAGDEGAELAAA